jgi:hypothetical protein
MASFDMALVDEVRKRLDASYDEALYGLEQGQGDLLRALAAIERQRQQERSAEESGEIIGKAIGLAKEGRLKGMRVKLGDRTVREVPLPKGPGGAVLGAVLSMLTKQVVVELVKGEPEAPADEEAEDTA